MNASQFLKEITAVEGFIELGLLEEAADKLEDLPSTFKTTAEVIALHVRILVAEGQFLKASFLAETLSMSDPDSLEKAMNVGVLKYQAGEYHEALQWLDRMKTQTALSHYLKAQCYGRLSEHEEMKASLRQAFGLDESLKMKALDDPAFENVFGEEKSL